MIPIADAFFEAIESLGPVMMDMVRELLPAFIALAEAMVPVALALGKIAAEIITVLAPIFVWLMKEVAIPMIMIIAEGWVGLLETIVAVTKAIVGWASDLGLNYGELGYILRQLEIGLCLSSDSNLPDNSISIGS